MKQPVGSPSPQPSPSDRGTDMVLRLLKIARLLERAAAQSEERRLTNATPKITKVKIRGIVIENET